MLKPTVLGDRSGLTPEMNRAFLDSGTYHILALGHGRLSSGKLGSEISKT